MIGAGTPSASAWVAGGRYLDTSAGRIFYRDSGSGPVLVLLHGFPTWSYDWAEVATILDDRFRIVTLDFPGYGFSDKHGAVDFSVSGAADAVEALLRHLGIGEATLGVHDFGGIVGQELLDRRRRGHLSFAVEGVHVLNNGIVYAAYRPTRAQKMLALPIVGRIVSRRLGKDKLFAGINSVRGPNKLDHRGFEELWTGMAHEDGYRLAYRHLGYIKERAQHHARWEAALFDFPGLVQLIWGLADPVSGAHVLELAQPSLPRARVVALPDVGHFPQAEAPADVAAAITRSIA